VEIPKRSLSFMVAVFEEDEKKLSKRIAELAPTFFSYN
jgi:hypothetical protein